MQHVKNEHTFKGLTKLILILLVLLLIVSCSIKSKDPTESFWGQWEYVDSKDGYDAFEYDIEFVSDGTFLIPETPMLMVNTFEYGLLDGNRLRLTALGQSEIIGYELDGDQLKLIFEDGYNLYRRKGSVVGSNELPQAQTQGVSTQAAIENKNKDQESDTPENAKQIVQIDRQNDIVNGMLAISPDGKRLAVRTDWGLYLYSLPELQKIRYIAMRSNATSVSFSPDGKTLASMVTYSQILLLDATTGEELRRIDTEESVQTLAFSPDGRTLAYDGGKWISGTETYYLNLSDVTTGQLLRKLGEHSDNIRHFAFSPDGKTLASASWDDPIRLWDVTTGQLLRELEGPNDSVFCLAFSPDGKTIAYGGAEDNIRIWDTDTGKQLLLLVGNTEIVQIVAFSPDGRTLASGGYDDTIRIWETKTGKELQVLEGHTEYVWGVAFLPDGRTLISASQDGTIRVWDTPTP